MNKNSISTNEELRAGDYLTSLDGNFKAVFQTDGNFVVYKWSPIWASDTWNKNPFRIILQEDNNLVMYTHDNKPVWASNSHSNQCSQKMRLTLTNQGKLVLDKDGQEIWSS